MASLKDILDRQKEVSDKISSQARTLAVSILAISWLLIVPGKDGPVLSNPPNHALLIAAGIFSLLTLIFDFLQYVFAYRTVQDALGANKKGGAQKEVGPEKFNRSRRYSYEYASTNYKAQIFFFQYKQYALVISAVALVIAIVWAMFGGAQGLGRVENKSAVESSSLVQDVAAIRRHIEEAARNTSPSEASGSSGLPEEPILLPAEWTLHGPSRDTIASVLVVLFGSGLFLLRRGGATGKAVGVSLVVLGALSAGGFSIVRDLKFESLVKFDVNRLFEYTRVAIRKSETPGPERIASIDSFLIGDESRFESFNGVEQVLNSGGVVEAIEKIKHMQDSGHQAVLLVIGATDRLPIRGAKTQQFEANVGLARARAETVRHALLERCRMSKPCTLDDNQIISLVSGPRNTPSKDEGLHSMRAVDGFPEDRRVDVWALWTRKSEGR